MADIKVGIVGATGYTGSELVRILTRHPEVNIKLITSRSDIGKKFSEIHPQYQDFADMRLKDISAVEKEDLDLVFLALPHGASMNFVKQYGTEKFKIIDLSGDFRFSDKAVYEKWYKKEHSCPEYLESAVFGLPELFRTNIRRARLIGNPGCYPTSAILGLAPLMKHRVIDPGNIIVDSKSGVTGAGAKPKGSTHFPDVFGNFSAYGLHNHRHTPEISSGLKEYSGDEAEVLFTPHLLPVDRGILSTIYSNPKKDVDNEYLQNIYDTFYKKEFFVRLVDTPPSIKNVRGSNFCDIHVSYNERTKKIIVISAIDNLVKGAAGQAIQNMNIIFDRIERTGLKQLPINP